MISKVTNEKSTDLHNIRPNLYDYLKVLALLTMIIDHIWFFFFPELEMLRIVWRLAFPIFLFLVWRNHSYRRHSNLRVRGGVFQIFLLVWYWYGVNDILSLNILLVIGLVRVVLWWIQRVSSPQLEGVIFLWAVALYFPTLPYLDYGTMWLAFGIVGYRARKRWATWWIGALIISTVGVHVWYMIQGRWYTLSVLLVCVSLMLVWSFLQMSKQNVSLVSGNSWRNACVLFLSTHCLSLYVAQAIFLTLMSLIVG